MTYPDDIWYVGGARAEVAHAEFWAWHMLIKYLICIIYAKICPEVIGGGPMTSGQFMEVEGQQRSNIV